MFIFLYVLYIFYVRTRLRITLLNVLNYSELTKTLTLKSVNV